MEEALTILEQGSSFQDTSYTQEKPMSTSTKTLK